MLSGAPAAPAKRILERLGFSVKEGVRVRGLSGFEHSFALVARKGGRMVCVSIVHSSPASILAEVAKGFDVPHEIVVAVEGEPPPKALVLSRKGRVKIVAFKSDEELAEELKKALA